jgi:hypothetical protein
LRRWYMSNQNRLLSIFCYYVSTEDVVFIMFYIL